MEVIVRVYNVAPWFIVEVVVATVVVPVDFPVTVEDCSEREAPANEAAPDSLDIPEGANRGPLNADPVLAVL